MEPFWKHHVAHQTMQRLKLFKDRLIVDRKLIFGVVVSYSTQCLSVIFHLRILILLHYSLRLKQPNFRSLTLCQKKLRIFWINCCSLILQLGFVSKILRRSLGNVNRNWFWLGLLKDLDHNSLVWIYNSRSIIKE